MWDSVGLSDNIVQLTNFALEFPDGPFADLAWKRVDELVKAGGLKVASVDNNMEFISKIIFNQARALPALNPVINRVIQNRNLEAKYPLGFAMFSADGDKIKGYAPHKQAGNISFDPSAVEFSFKDKFVCLDKLPIRVDGKLMENISNVCFGANVPVTHAVRIGDLVALDIELLGDTPQGLVWVIGMRPP